MEPFYFKSFDRVLGIAYDVPSLYYGVKYLSVYDKAAVEYHLKEGHISAWLDYIGEHELSKEMRGRTDIGSALEILEKAVGEEDKQPMMGHMHGKMGQMRGMGQMREGMGHMSGESPNSERITK